ncbi:MAG: hypothetical protein LUM44_04620 [Pyrinomonadaceae bacterium]|nr:hypothetical protein [Pyrinomonadaceae bacterium]
MQEILQGVAELHDRLNESFLEFENPLRAELFRLYGFYLTFAGRAKNKKDFHLRAKDALTIAIELFEKENLSEKAAESKVILAFAYWNNGEVPNAEALLDMVEMEFSENKFHPVNLQIKINRMMLLCWAERLTEAQEISAEILKSLDFCNDMRLRAMYHAEAAILFHHSLKYSKSLIHFNETIRLAKEAKLLNFLALNYNNFSLFYLDNNNYGKAHFYSKQSLEILEEIGHIGWIPHVLDSRANIYLAEQKFKTAQNYIEKSLEMFQKSDDFKGLAAALWTKCLILLRQSQTEDALLVFGELEVVALQNIGEVAARKYAKLLSNQIYSLNGSGYEKEIPGFKKFLVTRALHTAKGKKTEAARLLGFAKHQNLSDILKNQFPGLYESLGYSERGSRSDKNIEKAVKAAKIKVKAEKNKVREETVRKERSVVAKLDLGGKMLSFSWNLDTEQYSTFYFNANVMRSFDLNEGAVVVVVPSDEVVPGDSVVALDGERFVYGKVCHDSFSKVFFLEWEGETVFLTAENIIGVPTAYQSITETKSELIEFIKL